MANTAKPKPICWMVTAGSARRLLQPLRMATKNANIPQEANADSQARCMGFIKPKLAEYACKASMTTYKREVSNQ